MRNEQERQKEAAILQQLFEEKCPAARSDGTGVIRH